jgi:hypothetical protein
MTTTRFPVESNQLGDALDDREMGLHGVGQIGDCDPIQWPEVYATASRDSSSDPQRLTESKAAAGRAFTGPGVAGRRWFGEAVQMHQDESRRARARRGSFAREQSSWDAT